MPEGFERWGVTLGAGETRASDATEWSGALVMVDRGSVEVGCIAGATSTFVAGDVLALSCLPLRWLRNSGSDEARLVAVRRSRLRSKR
jgi:hypothetical protein